jgi:hypothetical protein
MASAVPIARLLRESAPAAVVLLLWAVVAGILPRDVAGNARLAGVVMALLYVVVRGVHLAGTIEVGRQPTDPRDLLAENLGVAVAAGAWFLAGVFVAALRPFVERYHLHLIENTVVVPLSFALGTTGVATVVLYAIAAGLPRVRQARSGENRDGDRSADVTPADD